MKKTYSVEKTFSGMRIDRWIRNSIKKIPQGLIEKNLRKGSIKVNGKKIKSSYKIKENDQIIMVSDKGQIIRVNINQIRIAGRSTQGVSIFKIPDSDRIVNVSRVQDLEQNL